MGIRMTSKNIAIKEEAYDFLASMKGRDRSFSDVILGFKKKKAGVMQFFGVLKDLDWAEKEKRMREFRKSFEERLK